MSLLPFEDIATAVVNLVPEILNTEASKQAAKQTIMEKMAELQAQSDAAQTTIDNTEAESPSIFISGPRPFIMWVGGFGFAWYYIIQPILLFIFAAIGHTFPLPVFDASSLINLVLALCGLHGIEKAPEIMNSITRK